jgi:hypothetical protein
MQRLFVQMRTLEDIGDEIVFIHDEQEIKPREG